jgi:HD-GYP domain-containing protein (c-di-GMP phosphodiesterase class II)
MEANQTVSQPQRTDKRTVEAMDSDLSRQGNNLVTKFHVLMKISQIYDSKNVALQQFVQESLQTINALIEREGTVSLKIVKDDLFLNEQRLRYSVEGFTSFKYLVSQWKRRMIGEIMVKGSVDEATLREFIYALMSLEENNEQNATLLNEALSKHKISIVETFSLEASEGEEEGMTLRKEEPREIARRVFFETIGSVKDVITKINAKQYADVRKLKRLAQNAVSLVMEDESILLGLTTIKHYDEYTFNHCVNVSIYAMAIGKRLGFSRKTLTELGITALLHDVGKSKIPIEVLNKPASLDETEWELMKKHPLMGVEVVLNLKQLGEINPKMVVGIFDHHLKPDLTGYPKLFRKKGVSLFGRIIQVADSYDAMTTPRIYKKIPYTPEKAMALLLRERGIHYDPLILKIFIGLVGIYPIGSLVLLTTREIGIVYKPNPDPELMDRPAVLLISRDEKDHPKKDLVDLVDRDENGRFRRTVVKTLDPFKYHIDIAKYMI